MVTCPHEECSDSDREFESDATMRQHHTKVHDEQLPNNSCDECGDEFFDKGSANKYCDDCRHEAHYVGETAPNYSGAKEKTKCKDVVKTSATILVIKKVFSVLSVLKMVQA